MKHKTIKTQWTVHLKTPSVPNFLIENAPGVGNSDENLGKYPISDFDDSVLRQIGEAWTEALIARAAEMRNYRMKK